MLGGLAGGTAGLFLALWNFNHGSEVVGLGIFLTALAAVLVLKDIGYREQRATLGKPDRKVEYPTLILRDCVSGLIVAAFIWCGKWTSTLQRPFFRLHRHVRALVYVLCH